MIFPKNLRFCLLNGTIGNKLNNSSLRSYSAKNVRVRFAPSPTGFLHLGGLRTALYNFLFAKKHKGVFVLRIEDTDQSRRVDGATEALQKDLEWAGIEIHEGPIQGGSFGPYLQSERLNLYRNHLNTLLKNKSAYPCFCTDRRLQLLKREAIKSQEVPKYDNRCRNLTEEDVQSRISKGDPHCYRFKISDKEESFNDLIYGPKSYNISLNEGDPVIMKGDGYPTYHFANVVDDHLMRISHVLRGVEWQISTTKHILMYRAFGWEPPKYGHLPLLINSDGTKLSKRQGDIKISSYRENHIFPLALLNFILNSGGGFDKDLERHLKPKCFTIDELCQQFELSNINTHSGKMMPARLLEFNNLELKRQFADKELRQKLLIQTKLLAKEFLGNSINDDSDVLRDAYVLKVLEWSLDRIEKLSDLFSSNLAFIWTIPQSYKIEENVFGAIPSLKNELNKLDDVSRDSLNEILRQISSSHKLKYPLFMKSLRAVLSGLKEGPSVAEMIEILGKENTIKRLDLYLNKTSFVR
ncbi:probable glutamate--tRNA ligase, mitochondrial [Anthonomus grandis grandis]|uniref:probable glutamate--tRNA ligase, mitochondrial n=1 Tax=Anthonomus grandis grandis TaxID=2921223 RepID=UPI0021660D16|nr:probable glutamate--tRNA ligase, mitochondrial [Anthonomus grandis grandis]